jgi:hypothetical protein
MELVPQELNAGVQGPVGRILNPSYLVLAAVLALAGGCVTIDSLVPDTADQPPVGEVAEVHFWPHNQVVFGPDPAHNGNSVPGLVARIYLTRSQMKGGPIAGDGNLMVQLFDPTQKGPDGQPPELERWAIKNEDLKRQLHRDGIGWGYTLLLPWTTYRPDITAILLRVRYHPPNGPPIYADPALVTLNPVQDFQMTTTQEPTPAGARTGTSPELPGNRPNPAMAGPATLPPSNGFAPQRPSLAAPTTR